MSDRARAVLYGHTFRATDNRRYVGLLAEPIEQRIEAAIAAAHATGREEGMREAAGLAREVAPWGYTLGVATYLEGFHAGADKAAQAILADIRTQEDSTSE